MKGLFLTFVLIFLITVSGCGEQKSSDSPSSSKPASEPNPKEIKPLQPIVVKRPAIDEFKIPDQPVSGLVMGQPFLSEGADISDMRSLDFWVGDRLFPKVKVGITLPLAYNESPAGMSYDLHSDQGGGFRPVIHLELKTKRGPDMKSFKDPYRLNLIFGETVEGRMPGRIFLSMPDQKIKIAGVFQVTAPENPAEQPRNWHRPYAHGRISFSPTESKLLMASYAGIGDDGEIYHNGVGIKLTPDNPYIGGHIESTIFKPRNTSIWSDDDALHYRHVRLAPGKYILAILWGNSLIAHQWQRVNEDSSLTLDVEIDLAESGMLLVEVPGLKESERVWLLPLNTSGVLPDGLDSRLLWRLPFQLHFKPEYKKDFVTYRLLPPGPYLALYKDFQQEVQVIAKKSVKINF